ncbi:adenylosuccinate lyase [Winogradskyella alexanderae]|uniref:Adenylosuccinate lyase n=1 Tax=Winogradskyella alexanderae TaxID=2877123 RepID=A0ABS7XQF9_9FLAO|nr:adenylosuccinate lyase [Winogradskyella alexanderae]MCA0132241.1 adenylosuccinate lyase [Winogradskyella alexanderae]
MTKDQLYRELNYVNATRESRTKYANLILENPKLLQPLLEILFTVNNKISIRAAWILEFVCKQNIALILPHIGFFISNLSRLRFDSAIRPCAKIVEILIQLFYKKKAPVITEALSISNRAALVEICFDWLITDQKVAVKAYSMSSLYLLGTEFDWIQNELKLNLQRNYSSESAAFKARAKYILQDFGVNVPRCKSKIR